VHQKLKHVTAGLPGTLWKTIQVECPPSVVNAITPLPRSWRMGLHSVTCHPAEVTFQPLLRPKLVLDLATPEGCKAELI